MTHSRTGQIRRWITERRVETNRIEVLVDEYEQLLWENESLKQRMSIMMEARHDRKDLDE